jgi:hypothetical protein
MNLKSVQITDLADLDAEEKEEREFKASLRANSPTKEPAQPRTITIKASTEEDREETLAMARKARGAV